MQTALCQTPADSACDAKEVPLSGQQMIYFGPEKWSGMWRNRHHLMSGFARTNKVIYVEPAYTMTRLRQAVREKRRSGNGGPFCSRLVTRVDNGLFVYHSPPFLPILGRSRMQQLTWRLWKALFKKTLKGLGIDHPIVWLSKPNMTSFIGLFREKLTIYHVVDEYLSYGNPDAMRRAALAEMEQRVLNQADMVVVVSEELQKSKAPLNPNTYLVPNGVDFDAYDRASHYKGPEPADLAMVPRPRIGYSGLVSRRLDLALVEDIAIRHPEWSLVLMGAVNDNGIVSILDRLAQRPNIHFLGAREISAVPHYVCGFDACMIPYAINEQTRNLSPLKLYDFLAAGKPTVITDIPAARDFSNLVYIAASKDAFTQHLETALAETDRGLSDQRMRVARCHTWESRVAGLSRIIHAHLRDRRQIVHGMNSGSDAK